MIASTAVTITVVTIQDVARAAGVGVGTASRALSGNPHVADDTRAHVQALAEQLGFRPSVQYAPPRRLIRAVRSQSSV